MQKVLNFLEFDLNLKETDILVVGTSGGPDSMALLSVLLKLQKKINYKIVCAHINHNLRKQSKKEAKDLEEYCLKNKLVFESMTIEEYGDDNFHNEARNFRYDFFDNLSKKYKANYLMTAHHADDLIETIIMKIVRGSTLKGYGGFSKIVKREGYLIVRPLFEVNKEQILKYCKKENIKYATDKSNKSNKYTRNRYRKVILPFLKLEDPDVHEKFIKFNNVIEENEQYLAKQTKRELAKLYHDKKIDLNKFNELEHLMKLRIIHYLLEEVYQDDLILITDTHANSIINLASSKKANAYIMLPNELKIIKEYDQLILGSKQGETTSYEIEIIDEVFLPGGGKIERIKETDLNNNYICRLNSKELVLPISVRTRKYGDKIFLKNSGTQKLKDLFINSKLSAQDRDLWPIVVDAEDKILWVAGLKKSKYLKQKNEIYDIILKYERGGINE